MGESATGQVLSPTASRVFIVEDEAIIAMELEDRLRHMGYTVCGRASRGTEALQGIPGARPDVVLMDINLPGDLNGIQVAERLRGLCDVPIIFLTAYSDAKLVDLATKTGSSAFLAKPFQEQVLRANIELVYYRHSMERRLADSKHVADRLVEQLAEAVDARDEFLAIASHELRTPLTALSLKLGQLRKRASSERGIRPEELDAGLDSACRQTARLSRLIDDLLDASRLVQGTLRLERETLDLAEVTSEVVERMKPSAERVGCALALTAHGPLVGDWDRLRLEQVLTNLLSNALKYAPGHPVRIELSGGETLATLAVKDEGPGVPVEMRERIFERFVRIGAKPTGGLGMGLYIARQIVTGHGGSIDVVGAPGAGATFVVTLPRQRTGGAMLEA